MPGLTAMTVQRGAAQIVFQIDGRGRYVFCNDAWEEVTGYAVEDSLGTPAIDFVAPPDRNATAAAIHAASAEGRPITHCFRLITARGDWRRVEMHAWSVEDAERGAGMGVTGTIRDRAASDAAEIEHRHQQKLEAVGRLAAGIAHEINSPVQFIGDNLHFLREAFERLKGLMDAYRQALQEAQASAGVTSVVQAELDIEAEYLEAEIPEAVRQALEGTQRVATIVRAMKSFGHPDRGEAEPTDLNQALRDTLVVVRNELKYVADVVTDLGDLPVVVCFRGDVNQVFLNLLVNAAHAIADRVRDSGQRGTISVRTRCVGDDAEITIGDDGVGIPDGIRDRIFDPFFTTKDVGRGTGQGLALARAVIVDGHGGDLRFASEEGVGTTFTIRLPIAGGLRTNPGARP